MFGFPNSVGGVQDINRVYVQPQEEEEVDLDAILDECLAEYDRAHCSPMIENGSYISEEDQKRDAILERVLKELELDGNYGVSVGLPQAPEVSPSGLGMFENPGSVLRFQIDMYRKNPEQLRKQVILGLQLAKLMMPNEFENFDFEKILTDFEIPASMQESLKRIDRDVFSRECMIACIHAVSRNNELEDYMCNEWLGNGMPDFGLIEKAVSASCFEQFKKDTVEYLQIYLVDRPQQEEREGENAEELSGIAQILQQMMGTSDLQKSMGEAGISHDLMLEGISKTIEEYQKDPDSLRQRVIVFENMKKQSGDCSQKNWLLADLPIDPETQASMLEHENFKIEMELCFVHAFAVDNNQDLLKTLISKVSSFEGNWELEFLQILKDNYSFEYQQFNNNRAQFLLEHLIGHS